MTLQDFARTASTASTALSGLDALNALNHVVDAVGGWIETIQTEETKRADIAAKAQVVLRSIAAEERLLLTYLDRSFDERAENFRQLFAALDLALREHPDQVADVLGSITTLAVKSPFADLADRDLVMSRLHDKDAEWEV